VDQMDRLLVDDRAVLIHDDDSPRSFRISVPSKFTSRPDRFLRLPDLDAARETDCVAGVVGLELLNPLGSKSARVAAGSSGDLAEMAQQRRFALELRRGECAAAVRILAGHCGAEGRTSMPAGLFNMPGW
jgi:hypothetical protein